MGANDGRLNCGAGVEGRATEGCEPPGKTRPGSERAKVCGLEDCGRAGIVKDDGAELLGADTEGCGRATVDGAGLLLGARVEPGLAGVAGRATLDLETAGASGTDGVTALRLRPAGAVEGDRLGADGVAFGVVCWTDGPRDGEPGVTEERAAPTVEGVGFGVIREALGDGERITPPGRSVRSTPAAPGAASRAVGVPPAPRAAARLTNSGLALALASSAF